MQIGSDNHHDSKTQKQGFSWCSSATTAGNVGLIPWGSKIPQAVRWGKKKMKDGTKNTLVF